LMRTERLWFVAAVIVLAGSSCDRARGPESLTAPPRSGTSAITADIGRGDAMEGEVDYLRVSRSDGHIVALVVVHEFVTVPVASGHYRVSRWERDCPPPGCRRETDAVDPRSLFCSIEVDVPARMNVAVRLQVVPECTGAINGSPVGASAAPILAGAGRVV
jgi:hypothetical protein